MSRTDLKIFQNTLSDLAISELDWAGLSISWDELNWSDHNIW